MSKAAAACVIGWPVAHSRSPLIHTYWLKHYSIAGEYRREPVKKDDLAAFLGALAARGYVGANVTVPHKEAALALAAPDAQARAVGAANTLWLDRGVLRATNTDVDGFLHNLDAAVPHWQRDTPKAVVLGAGGAARAVIYALQARGFQEVVVANRTTARAEALRHAFGARVRVAAWDKAGSELDDATLLVNTTTLGMQGQPALAIDLAPLPDHATVADLVYVPAVTPLLAAAKARGLRTADGLGMLLHQAVGGFALWFHRKPEVTAELRALVEADLAASAAGGNR